MNTKLNKILSNLPKNLDYYETDQNANSLLKYTSSKPKISYFSSSKKEKKENSTPKSNKQFLKTQNKQSNPMPKKEKSMEEKHILKDLIKRNECEKDCINTELNVFLQEEEPIKNNKNSDDFLKEISHLKPPCLLTNIQTLEHLSSPNFKEKTMKTLPLITDEIEIRPKPKGLNIMRSSMGLRRNSKIDVPGLMDLKRFQENRERSGSSLSNNKQMKLRHSANLGSPLQKFVRRRSMREENLPSLSPNFSKKKEMYCFFKLKFFNRSFFFF